MSLCHAAIRVKAYKAQCYICQQFGHALVNCKQPLAVCGVGASPVQGMLGKGQCRIDTNMLQLQVGGCRGTSSFQLLRLQAHQGRDAKEKVAESTQDFFSSHTTPGLPFAAVQCSNTTQEQQPQPTSVAQAWPATVGEMNAPSLDAQPTSTKSVLIQTVQLKTMCSK
jgi:hypothetical protein